MKKSTLIVAAVIMAMTIGGCSSVSYVTDWDTHYDFSRANTFAWYELPERPDRGPAAPAPNAFVASRIRSAVTNELSLRGLTSAKPGKSNLLVTYHIALQRNMHVYYGGWGHPYHGCWGWGGGYSSARMVTRGTLIVDVLDGSRRSLVWRGVAEGAFSKPNPSESDIAKIVSRLLVDFPVH